MGIEVFYWDGQKSLERYLTNSELKCLTRVTKSFRCRLFAAGSRKSVANIWPYKVRKFCTRSCAEAG